MSFGGVVKYVATLVLQPGTHVIVYTKFTFAKLTMLVYA